MLGLVTLHLSTFELFFLFFLLPIYCIITTSIQRKNGYTSCHYNGSWNNAHNRDAGNWFFRTQGKADTSAGNLPPPSSGVRVQIDDGSSGRDTSDSRQDLCRNDKKNDCCCISGM